MELPYAARVVRGLSTCESFFQNIVFVTDRANQKVHFTHVVKGTNLHLDLAGVYTPHGITMFHRDRQPSGTSA